jgi:PhoH-like ATPase
LQTYTGIRELIIENEKLQEFYEDGKEYGLYTNEYIKVKNTSGEVIYLARWDGEKVVPLKYNKINNEYFGTINAKNDEQKFLLNMLQDDSVVGRFCLSPFGCGKTFISLAWALNEVTSKRSKYNCIRYIRNNHILRDCNDIGFLPSGQNDKLKPWAMEIADILGDEDMLDLYIEQRKIILEYMGFCRGRSWERSIIFLEEAQNATPYQIATLMSRCGQDSCFIAVGDLRQTDKDVFTKNSGLTKAIDKLKGNPMFGLVTLQKNERSEFSSLADLLLED